MEPHHLTAPAPWAGHIPFASWLVALQRPRCLVELGAYSGISYLALCQAIVQQDLATRAYAIDTWEGDAHAGQYGEHIYQTMRKAHDPHYQRFSSLLRMRFDQALPQFADGSIDLLHIDGLHTYEAVRHDFETWQPKLSERAVVLFHDTAVRQADFGVYRLWAELSTRYPAIEFGHSNGLGVLLVGADQPQDLRQLCQDAETAALAQSFFGLVGARLERRADLLALQTEYHDALERAQAEHKAGVQRHQWIEQQDQTILLLQRQQQQAQAELEQLRLAFESQQQAMKQVQTLADVQQKALLTEAAQQQAEHQHTLVRQQQVQAELEQLRLALESQQQAMSQARIQGDVQQKALLARSELQQAEHQLALQRLQQQAQTELEKMQDELEQSHVALESQHQAMSQAQIRGDAQQKALLARAEQQQAEHQHALVQAQQQLAHVYRSRSWRATAGLRAAGRMARRMGAGSVLALVRRARRGLGFVARGDWQGLRTRAVELRRESAQSQALEQRQRVGARSAGIMATPHTLYVAHLVARALQRAGMNTQVFDAVPPDFSLDMYVVICPQMFTELPPGEKRIVFQMEQSVSSRWFTPEYLQTLENSTAVWDYAQTNLTYLEGQGIVYPHTYLVPIGGLPNYPAWLEECGEPTATLDTRCDVLFYGDVNAPRRQAMLKSLGERFSLRIEGNLFGSALRRAVADAKVVVNLHYYEGALLETTRIYECLSLGVAVVSEASADMDEHAAQLEGAVRFFPVGDIDAMLQAVAQALKQGPQQAAMGRAVQASSARFDFMLWRSLFALRMINLATWEDLTGDTQLAGSQLALSLPETPQRRSAFLRLSAPGVHCFDGMRYTPGWVGCALSYRFLAQKALQAGWSRLEVMEDDVEFPADYPQRRALVDAYLAEHEGCWDVFAGLIAIIHPDTHVLGVEHRSGTCFVTVDRMISMVHNIYAPTTLQRLAQWNPHNQDPHTNTIDRHLQNSGPLRVVVTLPFLVGHHEELHSSLWGVQNSQYSDLISQAQAELQAKVTAFEEAAQASP